MLTLSQKKKKPLNCLVPWPELLQLHHLGQPNHPDRLLFRLDYMAFCVFLGFVPKLYSTKKS